MGPDGSIYNGVGFKNDSYVSGSDTDGTYTGTQAGYTATGWIPFEWSAGSTLYIRGAEIEANRRTRFYGYEGLTGTPSATAYVEGHDELFTVFTIEELGSNYYKITLNDSIEGLSYIRISVKGDGETLIITNEEQ